MLKSMYIYSLQSIFLFSQLLSKMHLFTYYFSAVLLCQLLEENKIIQQTQPNLVGSVVECCLFSEAISALLRLPEQEAFGNSKL